MLVYVVYTFSRDDMPSEVIGVFREWQDVIRLIWDKYGVDLSTKRGLPVTGTRDVRWSARLNGSGLDIVSVLKTSVA